MKSRLIQFFLTTFLGGLIVILPIAILAKVIQWLIGLVTEFIAPVTGLMVAATTNIYLAQMLAFVAVVGGCFMVGLLLRTAWGNWTHTKIEELILGRIPGYKTLKELISKLNTHNGPGFSRPVLLRFATIDKEFLGFVTEELDDGRLAVFVPTSPSPVNGFVVLSERDQVRFLNTSSDMLMKAVIACGVGTNQTMQPRPTTPPGPQGE